jgi:hypothetical protein|tara:strand:- start:375 stop:842 length:468 start_codon:yes stop_codon:yes gene_type:complete
MGKVHSLVDEKSERLKKKNMVAMGFTICPATGTKNNDSVVMKTDPKDKESILLNGFSDSEKEVFIGWELCDSVKKRNKEGYICLVACIEEKSLKNEDGNITPEGAYRTGSVAFLRRELASQMFNLEIPEDQAFMFCDERVIQILNERASQSTAYA